MKILIDLHLHLYLLSYTILKDYFSEEHEDILLKDHAITYGDGIVFESSEKHEEEFTLLSSS